MERRIVRQRGHARALFVLIALLVAGGALSAQASPPVPERLNVELSSAAGLAPDGRSVSVNLLARCPEGWTVLQALVTVSQAEASGEGSFPLTCTGQWQAFAVRVQSTGASFRLGEAQASAFVLIKRGRTQETRDSQVVRVDPTVSVDLADTALLQGGGDAVLIDVTVACPVGATGQDSSYLVVSQGPAGGRGLYVPICDGQPHTFMLRVQTSQALFQPGTAEALTFADVEAGGNSFTGVDQSPIEIVN
jgi:hypothetical protein